MYHEKSPPLKTLHSWLAVTEPLRRITKLLQDYGENNALQLQIPYSNQLGMRAFQRFWRKTMLNTDMAWSLTRQADRVAPLVTEPHHANSSISSKLQLPSFNRLGMKAFQ